MDNILQSVPLKSLLPHPDNPNRMSSETFKKLLRNIKRSGRYEPLVVRPARKKKGHYQLIDGHQRRRALEQLGYEKADVLVWDVDDEQADILLATLNRLRGSDVLAKKIALLKRLRTRADARELSRLLPQTAGQIKRLINLRPPNAPAKPSPDSFANPLVFFVDDAQMQTIKKALSLAEHYGPTGQGRKKAEKTKEQPDHPSSPVPDQGKRTGKRVTRPTANSPKAAALTLIARHFLQTAQDPHTADEDKAHVKR